MASRIGRIPITITENVTITVTEGVVEVKGPKGKLSWNLPLGVELKVEDKQVKVVSDETASNLQGLTRTSVFNMIKGVTEEWKRVLELSGTGYRAATNGSELNLNLGFSHPVVITAPAGIAFEVKENKITVRGSDKVLVGGVAANIRKLRPADPYKAKGFKYENEIIVRKAGKAAKAGGTTGK